MKNDVEDKQGRWKKAWVRDREIDQEQMNLYSTDYYTMYVIDYYTIGNTIIMIQ